MRKIFALAGHFEKQLKLATENNDDFPGGSEDERDLTPEEADFLLKEVLPVYWYNGGTWLPPRNAIKDKLQLISERAAWFDRNSEPEDELDDPKTYYESAGKHRISHERALHEIETVHQTSLSSEDKKQFEKFWDQNVGNDGKIDAQKLLDWLGY
jgi:hypothetical protein